MSPLCYNFLLNPNKDLKNVQKGKQKTKEIKKWCVGHQTHLMTCVPWRGLVTPVVHIFPSLV